MDSAAEYMARKHEIFVNDYRTSDGRYSESCSWIALQLSKKLILRGDNPHIRILTGEFVDQYHTRPLIPRQYSGRLSWGAHVICCVGESVYDPLVDSTPLLFDKYASLAFSQGINSKVLFDEKKTKKLTERMNDLF